MSVPSYLFLVVSLSLLRIRTWQRKTLVGTSSLFVCTVVPVPCQMRKKNPCHLVCSYVLSNCFIPLSSRTVFSQPQLPLPTRALFKSWREFLLEAPVEMTSWNWEREREKRKRILRGLSQLRTWEQHCSVESRALWKDVHCSVCICSVLFLLSTSIFSFLETFSMCRDRVD